MGHALAFDTLTFASNLQEAGMDEKQAKALSTGLYNSQDRIIENLATKMDVTEVKADLKDEISDVKNDVAAVKNDVALVKKDLEVVKQELDSKIDKLDSKVDLIRKDMETSNNLIRKDMASNHQHVKWMIGTTLAAVVTILIRSFS